jgi:ribonuclease HI
MWDIDPALFHKTYYLEPGAAGMTTYSLLQQALAAERKCALTRDTLKGRERVAILRPWESCLLLQTLFYAKEIQSAPKLVIASRIMESAELSDLCALVDRSAGSLDHSRYFDRHQQTIGHVLQQKMHGTPEQNAGQQETTSPVASVRFTSASEPQPSASEPRLGSDSTIHVYIGVAQAKNQSKRFAYAYRSLDESGNVSEQVRVMDNCSSHRAELLAVIEALKEGPVEARVVIYTTSTYVSAAGSNLSKSPLNVSKWTQKYIDGQISNVELWREYGAEATSRKVVMRKANAAQQSRLKSIAQAALLAA